MSKIDELSFAEETEWRFARWFVQKKNHTLQSVANWVDFFAPCWSDTRGTATTNANKDTAVYALLN